MMQAGTVLHNTVSERAMQEERTSGWEEKRRRGLAVTPSMKETNHPPAPPLHECNEDEALRDTPSGVTHRKTLLQTPRAGATHQ